MRNLKKVLSMALAIVMMLGMMTFATAAETKTETAKASTALTDMKDVVNKEAVQLLVDLGVIKGLKQADATYKFMPKDNINRASYATMIYFIMQGDTSPDYLKGTTTGLVDVDGKNHWAEGYIVYCFNSKIAAGNNEKKFNPDDTITTVEAAKMLLTALGYVATDRGYEGDAMWSNNIMKDAKTFGILEGVDQSTSEKLTRDNAAQMIYNALSAKTVEATYDRDNGEKFVSGYTKLDTLGMVTFKLIKVTGVVTGIDADGNATFISTAPTGTKSGVDGKVPATTANLGQKVAIFVKGTQTVNNGVITATTVDKIYSSAVTANASSLLGSNVGVKLAKLTDKAEKKTYVATLAANPMYYVNGNSVTNGTNGSATGMTAGDYYINATTKEVMVATAATPSANDKNAISNGVVVELYETASKGEVDLVKLTIKEVKKVTGEVKTKTEDGVLLAFVPGICGTSTAYVKANGYEDLKKDDIVLTYANGGITYIEKAATVVAVVTGRNSDFDIKIDGTYTTASALKGTATDVKENIGANKITLWSDFDNEYTFYLDNGKNIVRYVQNTTEASNKFGVILAANWVSGGTLGSSNYMEAKMLFADATVEIVKVGKINGDTVVAANAGTGEVNYTADADYTYDKIGFVSYTVDKNGKYDLTVGKTDMEKSNAITGAVTNKAGFVTGLSANAKTVFIVEKGTGSDAAYTTYTGYANLPGMTATAGVALKSNTSTLCDYVFLTATAFTGDVADGHVYIMNPSSSEYNPTNKTYTYQTVAIDGTAGTISVNNPTVVTSILGSSLANQGLVTIKSADADGVVTVLEKVTPVVLNSIGSGTLVYNTSTVVGYDSASKMVIIDVSKDGKTVSGATLDPEALDITDAAYSYNVAVIAKDDIANYVYVIRTVK